MRCEDTTVGICLECGYVWCLECFKPLKKWPCPHWEICDACEWCPSEEELGKGESCPYAAWRDECPRIVGDTKVHS